MTRILIFLLSVVFLAGAFTLFAGMDGRIEAEAFGQKFNPPTGIALGAVIIFVGFLILFTSLTKDLMGLPGKIKARNAEIRRTRGVSALTRGLEAVAVGDATAAQHHARIARRNLEEPALTRLLTAQAAQLAGDEGVAQENFSAMLEAPETEFLGLHGLYLQARRAGELEVARAHAERAFKLRGNARWAFESVFDLGLQRGAWSETRAILERARKNSLVEHESARRGEAALLAANAYAAASSKDDATALSEAEAALKLAPKFTPAAVLAARLLVEADRKGKAAKLLERSFAVAPHPAIVKSHEALYVEETVEKRAEAFERLAGMAPESRESKLLLARRRILLRDWEKGSALLEPLLVDRPTSREFAAMAAAMAGAHGALCARPWFEKAADAPRDPTPGADGEFHFTREGWVQLVREFMVYGRLAALPLEDSPIGLTTEEIKLLAAPPVCEDPASESEARILSLKSDKDKAPIEFAPDETIETELPPEADEENLEDVAARAIAAARGVS